MGLKQSTHSPGARHDPVRPLPTRRVEERRDKKADSDSHQAPHELVQAELEQLVPNPSTAGVLCGRQGVLDDYGAA